MEKKSAAELLTSVDELFTTQAERDEAKRETVKGIPIAEISDFPNHPFKVRMDEAMLEMAESVKQYGVLVPAMVRPKPEGGYEMVAGHRRKLAAELAQQTEIPCLVRDLTDDEAIIYCCQLPEDGEEVLVCNKWGHVWIDTFDNDPDYGIGFETNGDMDGLVAWMPKPKPYKPPKEEK